MSNSPELDLKYAELLVVARANLIVVKAQMDIQREELERDYPFLRARRGEAT